jgi:hypothetical protein
VPRLRSSASSAEYHFRFESLQTEAPLPVRGRAFLRLARSCLPRNLGALIDAWPPLSYLHKPWRLMAAHEALWRQRLSDPSKPEAVEDFSGIVGKPLERVNVRSRSSQITRSAWKLEATSANGIGSILMVEVSPEEIHYRGEGIFLGWSQARLAAAYKALAPKSDDTEPDLPQLG